MTYAYEIRDAAGRICCAGNEPNFSRCPSCEKQTPTMRAAASASDYTPPDPYRAALEQMKKEKR